jgi:metal-sulfur cluster biosynthetic enzyme
MTLKDKATEVLKHVMDPELGIDVYTLGLIYDIKANEEMEAVEIKMTFTTPLCPYGPQLLGDIKQSLLAAGLRAVEVEVVFDPPWEPTPELREMLGV